jgi:hypothetical protein
MADYGDRPNIEKVMLYRRGFRDGAGDKAKRTVLKEPSYDKGYKDGSEAKAKAIHEFCREIGHDPALDILRTA